MNNKFEKLVKEAKKITLTQEEKGVIEGNLISFMKNHPVRNPDMVRQYYQRSRVSSIILTIKKNMQIVTIATALALMLGTGTAFAAQGSLPGNPLYPVKTNFDEKIEELMTFSTQGKAQLEAQLATERLQEAEQLSAQGNLNASNEAELQTNFEEHASSESNLVGQLQAEGNLEAAAQVNSQFESDLSAHQNILSVLNINPLASETESKVNVSKNEAANINAEITAQATTTIQADLQTTLDAVTGVVNQASQLLNNNESSIKASFFAQAQAQVNSANSAIAQAKVKISAGAYSDALTLLQQAQQFATEVNAVVQDKTVLNIGTNSEVNTSTVNLNGNATSVNGSSTGATNGGILNLGGVVSSTAGVGSNDAHVNTNASTTSGVQLNDNGLLNVPSSAAGVSGSAGGSGSSGIGLGGL